jgi:7,8-dihydropterin-6-yl-methyl-4-(beta-D-ribofuranosyl)aminobenzene 5'-phosphate synthase
VGTHNRFVPWVNLYQNNDPTLHYIMPMHCTGFEAIVAFPKERPDQFILNTAGTKYAFTP